MGSGLPAKIPHEFYSRLYSLAMPLRIRRARNFRDLAVSSKMSPLRGTTMANEPCGPTPAASEPVKPGTRMVHCVKFGRDMPGLDRPPWKGELGKRVFESVSKDAWKLWIEHSK